MNKQIENIIQNKGNYMQVESPYRTCPYKCPFCCSAFEGTYPFEGKDLYLSNKEEYIKRLEEAVIEHNVKEIIVTGMTEPTLFKEFCKDIQVFAKGRGIISVIQTMNHTYQEDFDYTAYSLKNNEMLLNPPVAEYGVTRYTVILSKDINIPILIRFAQESILSGKQVTIKYMAKTSNGHKEVDEWIHANYTTLTKTVSSYLKSIGVWIDEDCMNATEEKPSLIFRNNGKVFHTWLSKEAL